MIIGLNVRELLMGLNILTTLIIYNLVNDKILVVLTSSNDAQSDIFV